MRTSRAIPQALSTRSEPDICQDCLASKSFPWKRIASLAGSQSGKNCAPNGYLHAGTLVSVADSMCGYGTIVNLPDEAIGFVTIELKSNFLGTLRQGAFNCVATPVHIGRNTQVWDAVAEDEDSRRRLAVFRCTQMVLWDRS